MDEQAGIAYRVLTGNEAAASEDDLLALDREVYPGADHQRRARQLTVWRRQPGFALAEARHGGYLVGYAAGMPLRPSTSWWRDVTTPLPPDLTDEHPGRRTFALTELAVRAAWRRQGIGRELHDLILAGRTEERATVTAAPGATAAQAAFRGWGWHKVARTRSEGSEGREDRLDPVRDVLLTSLPVPSATAGPFPPGRDRAQNANID
jgi:ribosomal protein S18 acetylase RimI-like enzyme